jgi:hypothetical protein
LQKKLLVTLIRGWGAKQHLEHAHVRRGGPKFWPEFSDFYNIKVTSWLQHRFLAEQWLCAEKNPVIFCLTILDFQAWYCLIWLHCPYIVC